MHTGIILRKEIAMNVFDEEELVDKSEISCESASGNDCNESDGRREEDGDRATDSVGDVAEKKPFSEVLDWVNSIIYAIAVMLVLNMFFFRTITVSGDSMNNTLLDGERVVLADFCYSPSYGDIVVVQANKLNNKANGLFGEPIIKRVIALGGDTIMIDFNSGEVYLNNTLLEEDYIKELTHLRSYGWVESGETYTVPDNCVFVMGDNRNVSNDSRNLYDVGFIDESMIMGKAIFRYSPISEFKWL